MSSGAQAGHPRHGDDHFFTRRPHWPGKAAQALKMESNGGS